MKSRKLQISQSLKQLTHGKPNLPRCQQPCMFQILAWGRQSRCPPTIHGCPQIQKMYQNQHKSLNKSKQKCVHYSNQKQNKEPLKDVSPCKEIIDNGCKGKDCSADNLSCTIHGKQIKPNLYSFDKVRLKKSYSQDEKNTKTSFYEPQKKKQIPQKKLDQNNENDRKIIQQRKQRIKDFMLVTRDLPNTASYTYFGKPPFQAYGRGNSTAQIKTFNIMPQRGDNHPNKTQCYDSALIRGKKLSGTSNYIPRKPLVICKCTKTQQNKQPQQPINLPIQQPDLINNVRFSCEQLIKKKQGVPRQDKTFNTQKTKKSSQGLKQTEKGKKNKMSKSMALIAVNDGLKYMNKRDNLLNLLQQKKIKNSKLAFKVTECYPLPWNCSQTCQTNPFNADWQQVKPAGRQYPPSDHTKDIFKIEQKTQIK